MAKKVVMQGNEALAESALRAGCSFFAGYPITPQTEITEYLAGKMNDMPGRVFIQGESELASINMVFGASATGARSMTATSGQGISLMAGRYEPAFGDRCACRCCRCTKRRPGQ